MGGCVSTESFNGCGHGVVSKDDHLLDSKRADVEKGDVGGSCAAEQGTTVCGNNQNCPPKHVSLYSQQGRKGRPNQDAVVFCQDFCVAEGALCGVFDGHGQNGHHVSKRVRDCLPAVLLRQWKQLLLHHSSPLPPCQTKREKEKRGGGGGGGGFSFESWKEACFKAFVMMDKELKMQHVVDFACSGTTAITVIKQGDDLVIANLGDSRAVLGTISEDGALTAVQLTTDLKPNVPQEAERIRRCNGRIFALPDEPKVQRVWLPNDDYPGLAMARAFGDFRLKNFGIIAVPQVSHRRLTSSDQFIILATDGVWDVLSNKQVASIVLSAPRKEMAAKIVVDSAVNEWRRKFPASKMDDCTAVCLFLQN